MVCAAVIQGTNELTDFDSRVGLAGGKLSSVNRDRCLSVFLALNQTSLWGKIFYLLSLNNKESFTGCGVPEKVPRGVGNAVLNNYVSGDWSRSSGLLGDGSTKFGNTQFIPASHISNVNDSAFWGWVVSNTAISGDLLAGFFGAFDDGTARFRCRFLGNYGPFAEIGSICLQLNPVPTVPNDFSGFLLISRSSPSSLDTTAINPTGDISTINDYDANTGTLPTSNPIIFGATGTIAAPGNFNGFNYIKVVAAGASIPRSQANVLQRIISRF